MDFGFVITRHVNSEQTNKYWNQNVKLLRTLYPLRKIVVIDDNSDPNFVKSDHDYKNVEIIQSEYPGRGELLPFIYYLRFKWFENAIFLHDSVFIHKRVPFERIKLPVIPLWHFEYDQENLANILRISSSLRRSRELEPFFTGSGKVKVLGMDRADTIGCFGVMCFINHNFLKMLDDRYHIVNLANAVHSRVDRCACERIFGTLFSVHSPSLLRYKSLFGNIQTKGTWGYTYDQYEQCFLKENKIPRAVVKVWTGR